MALLGTAGDETQRAGLLGVEGYVECIVVFILPVQDGCFQQVWVHELDEKMGVIAQLLWVEVAQQHDCDSHLESEEVWWHASRLQGVEELHWVVGCLCFIHNSVN